MLLCQNCPQTHLNMFKPVQHSRQQVLRAYCPNIYTVIKGSWSEVCTLSLIFRSLPTTVAAANMSQKNLSNGTKRKLKFAPDYAITQERTEKCGLGPFYDQVRYFYFFDRHPHLFLKVQKIIKLSKLPMSFIS